MAEIYTMSMTAISNSHNNIHPNFDKLSAAYNSKPQGAASSAFKGSLETQEMIQGTISQMMKEVTPHLGQNLDIQA